MSQVSLYIVPLLATGTGSERLWIDTCHLAIGFLTIITNEHFWWKSYEGCILTAAHWVTGTDTVLHRETGGGEDV